MTGNRKQHNSNVGTVAVTNQFSEELHQLNNQSTSKMVRTSTKTSSGHPLYRCTVCGKEDKSYNLRNHIEMNHLEGVSIPCNLCEKTFTTLLIQKAHINAYHLDKVMVCEFCGQKFKYFGSLF